MNRLARYLAVVGGITALLVAITAWTPAAATSDNHRSERGDVLQFGILFGNMAPFIGAAGAVRGVTAAPLPWMIRSARGDLDRSGQLKIDVDHLVLANDPSVPPPLRGKNPVPFFAGIVSCLTGSGGAVVTANVLRANFPATMPGGNAQIHQKLTLPHPCVAPIVFVTSPDGGVWFAATGR